MQGARDALIEDAARQGQAVFALEAIKLVESGASDRCDELWIVVVPPAVQLARLAARGLDEAEVRRRLAWQGSLASWTEAFLEQSARLGRPRPVIVLDNGGTAGPNSGSGNARPSWQPARGPDSTPVRPAVPPRRA